MRDALNSLYETLNAYHFFKQHPKY